MSEVADDGAALTRQLSGHGPEYDALLAKGIPRQRLRRAWIACAGDAEEAEQYVRDNADQPSEFWDDPLAFPPPCQPEPESEKGEREHASKCEVAREQLRRALALLDEPSSTASLVDGTELSGIREAVLQALGEYPARTQRPFRASGSSSPLGLLAASALPIAEACAESNKHRCRRLFEAFEAARRPPDDPDAVIQLVPEDRVDLNLGCVRRQLVTRALASREAHRELTSQENRLMVFDELRKFSEEARPDCWVGATVVAIDGPETTVAIDDEHADELAEAVAEVRRMVDELVPEPRARQAVHRALRAQTHTPGRLPITVPAKSAFSDPTVICSFGEKSGATVDPEIPQIGDEIEIQLLCRPAVAIHGAACDEDADAVREAQRWCSSGAADKPRWIRGTVVAHSPWLAGSTLLAVEPLVDVADDTEPIIAPLSNDELSSIAERLASEIAPGRIKKLPTVNDEGKKVTKSRHYARRRHYCGSDLGERGQCGPAHENQCASCRRYDEARGRACPRHWWLRYSNHLHHDSDDSGDEGDDGLPELDWSWKAVVCTAPQPFSAGVLTHEQPASPLLAESVQNESGSPGRKPARAWIHATEPAVVLSRKLAVSKRLCREHPELLVGQQLQLWAPTLQLARSGYSYDMSDADILSQYNRPTTCAVVRGYVRETGMHVVQVGERDVTEAGRRGRWRLSRDWSDEDCSDEECSAEQMRASRARRDQLLQQQVEEYQLQLINLKQVPCLLRPGTSALPVAESTVIAEAGTHTHQCQVCWSTLLLDDFVDFCFKQYRVDGHETDIGSPRHPYTVCRSCLRHHVAISLDGGKLSVRCPVEGCGRALQTGELRSHTSTSSYIGLMERIRAAEEAMDSEARAAQAVALSAAGLELRSCPRCGILIEKNQGCDHMRCYRCDHGFSWSAAAFAGQGTRAANAEQTLRRYDLSTLATSLRLPRVAIGLVSGYLLGWDYGIQLCTFAIWQLLRLIVWVCGSPGQLLWFFCSSVWTGSYYSALPCFYLAFWSFWMHLSAINYTKVVTLLGVAGRQHDSLLRRVLYVIRREDQSSYYRSEAVRESLLGLAFMIFAHLNVCWFFAQITNDSKASTAATGSFWNFLQDSSAVAEGHPMSIRQDDGRCSVIDDGSASCVCNDVDSCVLRDDAEVVTEMWWSFPAVAYWIPPLLPACVLWHHLAEWLFVRVMCWRVYYLMLGARVVPDHRRFDEVISATFEDANYCNSWMVKLCYVASLLGYAYRCAADAGLLTTSMACVLASGSTLLTFAPIVWHRIK